MHARSKKIYISLEIECKHLYGDSHAAVHSQPLKVCPLTHVVRI